LGIDEDGTSVTKKKRKNKTRRDEDASRTRPSVVQEIVNSDESMFQQEVIKVGGVPVTLSIDSSAVQSNAVPEPTEDDVVSVSESSKKSKKKKKDRSKASRPSVVQELVGGSEDHQPLTLPAEQQLLSSAVGGESFTLPAEQVQYKDVTLDQFSFSTKQLQQQPSTSVGANILDSANVSHEVKSNSRGQSAEAPHPTSGHGRRGNMVNNVGVAAVKTPNRNLRDIKLSVKNRYDVTSKHDGTLSKGTADANNFPSESGINQLPAAEQSMNSMTRQSLSISPEAVSSNRSTVLTPMKQATQDGLLNSSHPTTAAGSEGNNTSSKELFDNPVTPIDKEGSYLDDLRKEYTQVKESLSQWKQEFVVKYEREPTTDDFANIDVNVQMLILRKDELSQLISQSKSRRKSTMGGSREKSPKRKKSMSGSIVSESAAPASISSESVAMEMNGTGHPSDETLLVEYEDVKQKLKLWKQKFVGANNREPSTDDFVTLDAETQMMILRRDELKQLVSGIKEKKRASKSRPTAGLDAITEVTERDTLGRRDALQSIVTQSDVRENTSGASATDDRSVDLSLGTLPVKSSKRVEVSEIYNKVDLLSELSSVKKVLSQWRRDFVATNGREPSPADFITMSPDMQALMMRREEIKALLNSETEKRVTIVNHDSVNSDGSSRPLDYNPDRMADKLSEKKKNKDRKKNQMDTDLSSLASEVSDITAEDDVKYKREPIEAVEISSVQSSPAKQSKKGKKAKKKGGEDGDVNTLASTNTKSTVVTDDDPLRKEYQEVKKYLKKWKADFVREHGREPDNRDLEMVDAETQRFIVRQFELKEALDERDRKAAQDALLKKSIKSALHTYHE